MYSDKDIWYEQGTECVTATYTPRPEKWIYKVSVNNKAYNREKDTVSDARILGTEETVSNARCDDQGNCKVKFFWYPEGNYQVLHFDKTSYSIVYGCDKRLLGIYHTNQAWLLSRTPSVSDQTV